ncbi:sugar phosphate isomerase/epimerase family protein [Polaromonas sp. UC242_47]|uniref:sugar phosphate isomerase/epimerase family protein n=1 Tax=Polaromonas sp. UC242_47 TaxID=3374626 RepID=UPI00378C3D35
MAREGSSRRLVQPRLKIALCNEVLANLSFVYQCKAASAMGYDGLEVAPFTLAANPMAITDVQAAEFARIAQDHGITIFGLHWLLVAPAGLSLVSPDATLRERTTEVMCRLVELCKLMGGSYLVHGSPKQRAVPPGATMPETLERARECLARAAVMAEACDVTYCIEPLSQSETDVLNTVAQAAQLVDDIHSPAFKTMIDCSAAGQSEVESVSALMEKWMPTGRIGHVQVNDPNRRGPGQGAMRFKPIMETLLRMCAQKHYSGIIAVEPFDYVPDGMGSAAHSIGYLRGIMQSLEKDA